MKNKYLLVGLLTSLLLVSCGENNSISDSSKPSSDSTIEVVPSTSEDKEDSSLSSSDSDSSISSPSSSDSSISSPSSSDSSVSSPSSSDDQNSSEDDTSSSDTEVEQGGESVSTDLYKATIKNNAPDDYYEPARGLKGPELKKALHEIINDHQSFGYSETQKYYKITDRDPHDSSKMYFIYTGLTSVNTGYNKEHVWAKSHGKFENKYPMHSDMHNLHPCNSSINSSRGHLDFDEGGELLSNYPGNNRKGETFEPSDFSKGDTARTIFYMATRYEGDKGEMNLEVSGGITSQFYDFSIEPGVDGVHGNFNALYKWATSGQDPVDDFEVSRNNIIYTDYQHNRNPFIDHPEFIQMIYDKNYNGPGALLDNNPHHIKTPEEEAADFIKLVDLIDETNIDSKNLIERAESMYSKMSDKAKTSVADKYQEFLIKQGKFEEFSAVYFSDKVIELIDNLGEITLDSKDKIIEAETAYNDLTDKAKELVNNYQTLVDARNTYDRLYQEWKDSHPSEPFVFDFDNLKGAENSYKSNVEITDGNRAFLASYCYKKQSDFRLGNNNKCEVAEKFKNAIGSLNSHSASLESLFDISGNKLILNVKDYFGTIEHLYLLKSIDGGETYSLLDSKKFQSKGSYEFDIDSTDGRYALVIDGNEPRMQISTLEVQ